MEIGSNIVRVVRDTLNKNRDGRHETCADRYTKTYMSGVGAACAMLVMTVPLVVGLCKDIFKSTKY